MKKRSVSTLIPLLCSMLLACGGDDPQPAAATGPGASGSAAATSGKPAAAGRQNEAPVIVSVDLLPGAPSPGDRLSAEVEAYDPDGDPIQLSYEWIIADSPRSASGREIVLHDTRKGEWIELTVVARDSRGASDSASQSATIANRPPALTGVEFRPREGLTVARDLHASPTATDADDDTLAFHYEWSIDGRRIHEDAATLPASSFRRGNEIRVRVWADDGEERSDALESRTIQVVNAPPRFVSHPQRFDGEEGFHYALRVEDPDGDRLFHYRLLSGPVGMTLDSTNALVTWMPDSEQVGKHQVKLEVDDRKGGRDEQAFELSLGSSSAPAAPAP
ncbi:MAG: hypothetical protein JRH19_26600 [Deltaproteobacteria bacterium]|nr:hypothetical protein [Deltaproteobacteria bacterium]